MSDPRTTAAAIVGVIAWETELRGFCKCPGEALHTHKSGAKDCRIHIDGAPTIHCVHHSCSQAVADGNMALRRALGESPWEITMPGGKTVRSGDVVKSSGVIIPREAVAAQAKIEGRTKQEQALLLSIEELFTAARAKVLEIYHWPLATIEDESPRRTGHRTPEEQFRMWLRIWPQTSHVWIGDVYSSGRPEHAANFRPASEWAQIGPVMGNYTCGSSFKPGTIKRGNEFTNGTQFLVVESDELDKDQVGAVFGWLNQWAKFNLHAIIDTGGKSLHGWFDRPRTPRNEPRLKAAIKGLACDHKMFTYSQPVRVPGAWRADKGKMQRLVWLKEAYA